MWFAYVSDPAKSLFRVVCSCGSPSLCTYPAPLYNVLYDIAVKQPSGCHAGNRLSPEGVFSYRWCQDGECKRRPSTYSPVTARPNHQARLRVYHRVVEMIFNSLITQAFLSLWSQMMISAPLWSRKSLPVLVKTLTKV